MCTLAGLCVSALKAQQAHLHAGKAAVLLNGKQWLQYQGSQGNKIKSKQNAHATPLPFAVMLEMIILGRGRPKSCAAVTTAAQQAHLS